MAPVVLFQVKCKECGVIGTFFCENNARSRKNVHIEATKHPCWVNKRLITAVVS